MKRLIEVFRSPRKAEMYLYVDKAAGYKELPDALLKQFGEPESVMTLVLTPERKLARADAAEVLQQIEAQGFYLQMPPTHDELLRRDGAGD